MGPRAWEPVRPRLTPDRPQRALATRAAQRGDARALSEARARPAQQPHVAALAAGRRHCGGYRRPLRAPRADPGRRARSLRRGGRRCSCRLRDRPRAARRDPRRLRLPAGDLDRHVGRLHRLVPVARSRARERGRARARRRARPRRQRALRRWHLAGPRRHARHAPTRVRARDRASRRGPLGRAPAAELASCLRRGRPRRLADRLRRPRRQRPLGCRGRLRPRAPRLSRPRRRRAGWPRSPDRVHATERARTARRRRGAAHHRPLHPGHR